MIFTDDFIITKVEKSRLTSVSLEDLPFGRHFTDHMLEVDYVDGEWGQVAIKPYQSLSLSPSCATLHYGQAIFEGVKAYRNKDGEACIFRPEDKLKKFNKSS